MISYRQKLQSPVVTCFAMLLIASFSSLAPAADTATVVGAGPGAGAYQMAGAMAENVNRLKLGVTARSVPLAHGGYVPLSGCGQVEREAVGPALLCFWTEFLFFLLLQLQQLESLDLLTKLRNGAVCMVQLGRESLGV